mmetsp:Transcript_6157/g.11434  ORF Transcript_6157/g.11434 Transcript_6157/m.11434 type:complete len:287 (+) Transcript_6157:310-1170(+)
MVDPPEVPLPPLRRPWPILPMVIPTAVEVLVSFSVSLLSSFPSSCLRSSSSISRTSFPFKLVSPCAGLLSLCSDPGRRSRKGPSSGCSSSDSGSDSTSPSIMTPTGGVASRARACCWGTASAAFSRIFGGRFRAVWGRNWPRSRFSASSSSSRRGCCTGASEELFLFSCSSCSSCDAVPSSSLPSRCPSPPLADLDLDLGLARWGSSSALASGARSCSRDSSGSPITVATALAADTTPLQSLRTNNAIACKSLLVSSGSCPATILLALAMGGSPQHVLVNNINLFK